MYWAGSHSWCWKDVDIYIFYWFLKDFLIKKGNVDLASCIYSWKCSHIQFYKKNSRAGVSLTHLKSCSMCPFQCYIPRCELANVQKLTLSVTRCILFNTMCLFFPIWSGVNSSNNSKTVVKNMNVKICNSRLLLYHKVNSYILTTE